MLRNACFLVALTCLSSAVPANAQGPLTTAFSYQGEVQQGGSPANGTFDIRFRLYDGPDNAATQLGSTLCFDNVVIAEGRFSQTLDFGSQFSGSQRFLEIELRVDTGAGCGDATGYTTLAPRQQLAAVPYALYSLKSGDADNLGGQPAAFYTTATNLTGTLSDLRLSSNVMLRNSPQSIGAAHTFLDNTLLLSNSAGTGSTTLRAPNATASRIINLPDGDGTIPVSATSPLAISPAGVLSMGIVPISLGGTGSNSAGSARVALDAASIGSPNIFVGVNTFANIVSIFAPTVPSIPLSINGVAGATGNLTEWNVAGIPKAVLSSAGVFTAKGVVVQTGGTVSTPTVTFGDGSVQSKAAKISKNTVTIDVPAVAGSNSTLLTVAVAGAALGDGVVVNPANDLGGIIIATARVSSAGNVEIRFTNPTFGAINPASMSFTITLLQ